MLNVLMQTLTGLLAVVGGFVGARMSVRGSDRATAQRAVAARREEWWRRFTWAAELTLDDSSTKRASGLRVLTQLALSDLSQRDEYLILDAFPGRVLGESEEDKSFGTTEEQVAAAQLRVALDHKLGRNTQDYVRRLAGPSHALRVASVRNRRMHNAAYACALVGSLIALSLLGVGVGDSPLLWCAFAAGFLATVANGLLGYFKFKDRELNLLRTADTIDAEVASKPVE